jgi:hypothetical protein
MSKPTHCQLILDYLDEFGSISPLEAIRDIGCYRLASRISDLRGQGYPIKTDMETVINRRGGKSTFARYSLEVFE